MQDIINSWMGRSFIALIVVVAVLSCGFSLLSPSIPTGAAVPLARLIADAQAGKIASIEIQRGDAQSIYATYRGQPGVRFPATVPADQDIIVLLQQAGVAMDDIDVRIAAAPAWGSPMDVATVLLPIVVMAGGFVFFMRYARSMKAKQL